MEVLKLGFNEELWHNNYLVDYSIITDDWCEWVFDFVIRSIHLFNHDLILTA